MGEFGKHLTLINIVLSFNHLQPLNPETISLEINVGSKKTWPGGPGFQGQNQF